jgi:flagellar basal body-associated protein FliL
MAGFNLNNMGSMITTIVAVPFVIVALVLMFIAFRSGRKASVSRNWPMTTGKILAAGIEPRQSHTGSGYSTSYYPVVQYEYTVNGQRFLGNRITFGMQVGYGWTGMAQKQIAGYTAGSNVAVFYDPNEPSNAVLERTGGTSSRILWIVAIVILVILAITVAFTSGINGLVNQVTSGLPR